jgi:hypothetical protein
VLLTTRKMPRLRGLQFAWLLFALGVCAQQPAPPQGGRTGAVLSTLIATCKRLRIDPFAYLRDLFARIAAHPQNRLDALLPDQWMAARMATPS